MHIPHFSVRSVIVAVILASILAAPSVSKVITQLASATFPGINGRIYFDGDASGNNEIYSMNPDGSGLTRITNNPASDTIPQLSPDGTKIAFTSDRDGSQQIYVMNADGTGQMRLTFIPGDSSMPAWSPDGSKIAFNNDGLEGRNIYVMNADGSSPKSLTSDIVGGGLFPAWSPDGSKIAFSALGNLTAMNADGTDKKDLGQPGSVPDWSPDGKKIVFGKEVDVFNFGIYTINSDGTNLTSLLNPPSGYNTSPKWSPDGTRIAFQKGLSGARIYVMNPDGSGQTNVTPPEFPDYSGAHVSMWAVQSTTPPPPLQKHFDLTVKSVDLSGSPVTGLWTTVRGMDGTLLKSGFTPFLFTGDSGTSYKVTVANYDDKVFSKWLDDGSTSASRIINLSANTTLTAVYDTGDALRGFTSLTYTGTGEQPDLTVNAVTVEGNTTLHMWMIIDPQSTNSSGTTYKVYATNGYQNLAFDHWGDNNSAERVRTLTIDSNTTITAYYRIR